MKIGIITYYHDSHNYGGCLQAFALCQALNEKGYSCEQITYDYTKPFLEKSSGIKGKIKKLVKSLFFSLPEERLRKFGSFRNQIPHSETVYDRDSISSATDSYSCFIAGSDQVWNFDFFDPDFFLEFVPDEITKIAYAVSFGKTSLSDNQISYTERQILRFSDVSFREKTFIGQFSSQTEKQIAHVPDPVFLIGQDRWRELAGKRIVDGQYVFCHFIGDDREARKAAEKFAREKGYQLVVLPHPSRINRNDLFYGDIAMKNAGPVDFLSLIKNADYVFTDSFHCSAFSIIFNRQFFCFQRFGREGMSSRIKDLTECFNCQDHFIDKDSDCGFAAIKEINYSDISLQLEKVKQIGEKFLLSAIEKGNGR